jgi:hypothetical protein
LNTSFIFLILLTLARASLAVPLFLTARKNKLDNLYWLAASFALAVYSIFSPAIVSPFSNAWVFHLGFMAGHFCLAMFIHTTFYRNRRSPISIFLVLIALGYFVDIYGLAVNDLNLVGIMTVIGIFNWGWHFFVARSAYVQIAEDPSVENWVKARYRLMMLYCAMIMISGVQLIISSTDLARFVPPAILPFFIILTIAGIVLQFLVWVMPESFREWLNRRSDQGAQDKGSMLNVFGVAMTENTGLKSIACLYAIRSTVSKMIGSSDSDVIQSHFDKMTYQDWESVLQNPELRRVLMNGGASQESSAKAIQNASNALVEKQSLLTFSIR